MTHWKDWQNHEDLLCAPSLMHVWLQLPINQASSCCSWQQATGRRNKNQRRSKVNQPAMNFSGPASAPLPVSPAVATRCCSQHKSPHESQPSSLSCCMPKSTETWPAVLWGCQVTVTSYWNSWITHFPARSLLSLSQVWNCPCFCVSPRPACAEPAPKVLALVKATLLREGIRRKGCERSFMGRGHHLQNKKSPDSEEKSAES